MAHARLVALALLLGAGCGDPAAKTPPTQPDLVVKPAHPPSFASDATGWGAFHSKRFNVSIPLPDGKAWKIDDHKSDDLVATHAPTSSRLTLRAEFEEQLMNRARCEARARARGIVPDNADAAFTTVEDEAWVGPESYDSRVWVAVEAGRPDGRVVGHVFLFGSFVKQCLLVHFSTEVPAKEEQLLADRLAIAEERIVKAIKLDAPRTIEDAPIPAEKPDIHR